MLIRAATTADTPRMMELSRAAETAAQWSEAHYQSTLEGKSTASAALAPRFAWVLEDCGVVQGFVVARVVGEEWDLENIVVAEAERRRGLATRLLRALLDRAHESRAQSVFLEVRASNVAARRLYEGQGFSQSGRRPGYYHDPAEDAILYSCPITPAPSKNG